MFRVSEEEATNKNLQGNEEGVKDKFSLMMFGTTRNIEKSEPKLPASPARQDDELPFNLS